MIAAFATIAALLTNTQRHLRLRYHRLVITLYSIYGLLYLGFFAASVFALLRAWHGQEWIGFWGFGLASIAAGSILLGFMEWADFSEHLHARIILLQEAARTGDESLAPLAPVLDGEKPLSTPPFIESTLIGPFQRPTALHSSFFMLATFVWVMAFVLIVPTLLAFGNATFGTILATVLVVCGGALGLLAHRTFGPFYAKVDAEGLRWPAIIGRSHQLSWHEAKSLFRVTDERQISDDRRTVYAVVAEKVAFAWTITGDSSETAAGVASRQILHGTIQHTGLPLRDLSAEARRLAHHNHAGISPQRKTRVWLIGSAPMLLLTLVAGILQVAQPRYFDYLYTRSHTSTPLYADHLTHPDSDWPLTDATAFVDGAYTITHDLEHFTGEPNFIPVPRIFDNALYEVTTRVDYSLGYDQQGIGLAIRRREHIQPPVVFYVTPIGEWWLERVPQDENVLPKTIRFDDSPTIHRGFGALNHIAVLVQGSDFTFYVNGHYITRYHDDHYAGGYIGLYLAPIAHHGSFTDFAIYPT